MRLSYITLFALGGLLSTVVSSPTLEARQEADGITAISDLFTTVQTYTAAIGEPHSHPSYCNQQLSISRRHRGHHLGRFLSRRHRCSRCRRRGRHYQPDRSNSEYDSVD